MSQENVGVTRRAFQAFNDRDLDAFRRIMDEDVEAITILATMDGGYPGHEGARRWWADLIAGFPDARTEGLDMRDLGDRNLATLRLRGHGAETRAPFEAAAWHVTDLRHGKCIRWRVDTSEREALEGLGLSEQPPLPTRDHPFSPWSRPIDSGTSAETRSV